jgi:hypothetical protein
VITGFNTDIEFQGTIYHVQTEDKGVKTPLILSLVYDRGTILASKRSAYNDLLTGNFDEKILAERLQKQHNLICAAVRTGRIEDLKRMAAKEAALKQKTTIIEKEVESVNKLKTSAAESSLGEKVKTNETEILNQPSFQEKIKSFNSPQAEKLPAESFKSAEIAKNEFVSKPNDELIWDVPIDVIDETLIDVIQIADEDLILSEEAVEIISDYVAGGAIADTKLKVRLLSEEKLKSGDSKTLRVLVNRGNSPKGLSGIQVITKILGSAFTPLIFHTKTDNYGIATVHLQLPHFVSGRAAILIKAITEGEEADLRRAIAHG